MDAETQRTRWCEFPGFSFCLIYPRFEAERGGNLKIPSDIEEKETLKKAFCF